MAAVLVMAALVLEWMSLARMWVWPRLYRHGDLADAASRQRRGANLPSTSQQTRAALRPLGMPWALPIRWKCEAKPSTLNTKQLRNPRRARVSARL